MIVTIEHELSPTMCFKFQRFHEAQQEFLFHDDTKKGQIAERLKPYIDKHWDLYEAWKKKVYG